VWPFELRLSVWDLVPLLGSDWLRWGDGQRDFTSDWILWNGGSPV